MNKTTALVGIVAGLTGAGITYGFQSRDTTRQEGVSRLSEAKSNVLNVHSRISSQFQAKYGNAIKRSREYVRRYRDEIGSPGVVVGVSVNGTIIWEEGFGYANLETSTPCMADTAMRIASISKPISMTLLAKLYESEKVSFDRSIHEYVPFFPKKTIDGQEVDITVRQVASHTAGIRHYKKKGESSTEPEKEFYLAKRFENVEEAVEMFKNDELLFKPGTSYEYSTHGYTLLSAVIENAGKKPFPQQINSLFRVLGLENTHLDLIEKIIYGRASYYKKNKQGRVVNADLADNSYKWAGGGFVSTVGDLLKFGNAMLYCYQQSPQDKPGYLKKETVKEMWTPVANTKSSWEENAGYGLGWIVAPDADEIGGVIQKRKFYVGHSGGAVGASSILMVFPQEEVIYDENKNEVKREIPQGVVVAILVNLENVSCSSLGKKIAEEFSK